MTSGTVAATDLVSKVSGAQLSSVGSPPGTSPVGQTTPGWSPPAVAAKGLAVKANLVARVP